MLTQTQIDSYREHGFAVLELDNRGSGNRGGNARDDRDVNVMTAKRCDLLAAAAENERIAALEADHGVAGSGVKNQ